MFKNFDEFVNCWKTGIKNLPVKKSEAHLLFLVVYPDELVWDLNIEKQTSLGFLTQFSTMLLGKKILIKPIHKKF